MKTKRGQNLISWYKNLTLGQRKLHTQKRMDARKNNGKLWHSQETKEKMRLNHKGSTGKHWKLSEITKMKQSKAQNRENNGYWKGGKAIVHHLKKNAPRPKPEQCEICGSIGNICLDHDHKTNKFRGWICSRCNLTLGMVKDNTETLMALVEYLNKNRTL